MNRPACLASQRSFRLLLAALLTASSPAALSAGEALKLKRGISISHVFGWAPYDTASRAYLDPLLNADDRILKVSDAAALHGAGLDFIRLAVDPGPFLSASDSQLEEKLFGAVDTLNAIGLAVIVDFHPSDLNPAYSPAALTAGAQSPAFTAYLGLLKKTAQRLQNYAPGRVALELMNEPPVDNRDWQPMLEAAYRAARASAPTLTLVAGGGLLNSADSLIDLDPASLGNDPNVIYTFHYYDPGQFTHQGAPWNAYRYFTGVPYPPTTTGIRESLEVTADAIRKSKLTSVEKSKEQLFATEELGRYLASSFERTSIAWSFDRVADWAKRHDIAPSRILLGEFGVRILSLPSLGANRLRWLQDVRQEAEARGFAWSAWVYKGAGGFEMAASADTSSLEIGAAIALGLRAR